MKKKLKLSVVIPCFNEAENVTLVLKKFQEILNKENYDIEIIVIDGGSSDNTPQELVEQFRNLNPKQFKLILNKQRGGYGNDIMEALSTAEGDVLAWTHADLQTDPFDIIKAFELYLYEAEKEQNIFIKGKRKNRHFMDACFTFGMQIMVWLILKTYLSDINAQPKMFSRQFYDKHLKNDYPQDFSLDLYALYQGKKNGYKTITFPVYFAKRIHGLAKGGGSWKTKINLIVRTFNYIVELKNKLKATRD
jgi:glycosyltransferase involved in cell wall biosynthesis